MSNMKVKLPEIQLTSDEARYLVMLLEREEENLGMDLSGAPCVNLSSSAIRLLNGFKYIVDSLLHKLGGGK